MLALTCVLLSPLCLTGCVVNDIHAEMQATNQRLEHVQDQLAVVDQVNQELQTINEERLNRLASIEQSLASIDESLKRIDTQLAPIGESLASVDGHLASLRKTINNIDSTIPFLRVSGDSEEEADALEAETSESAPAAPEAPAPAEPAEPAAPPAGNPEN